MPTKAKKYHARELRQGMSFYVKDHVRGIVVQVFVLWIGYRNKDSVCLGCYFYDTVPLGIRKLEYRNITVYNNGFVDAFFENPTHRRFVSHYAVFATRRAAEKPTETKHGVSNQSFLTMPGLDAPSPGLPKGGVVMFSASPNNNYQKVGRLLPQTPLNPFDSHSSAADRNTMFKTHLKNDPN